MTESKKLKSWQEFKNTTKHKWLRPLFFIEWCCEKVSYSLGQLAFFEILEYIGRLAVLVAIIFWWIERGDRQKAKHYQAWQVINLAQGKPVEGGRITALEDLCRDWVSLANIDLSKAKIDGVFLKNADLRSANLSETDLSNANLSSAILYNANLSGAYINNTDLSGAYLGEANLPGAVLSYSKLMGTKFYFANLSKADLSYANLSGADLVGANLSGADIVASKLKGANFWGANLSGADLYYSSIDGIKWNQNTDINNANIYGVKNAPVGFIEWAQKNGAVRVDDEDENNKLLRYGEPHNE